MPKLAKIILFAKAPIAGQVKTRLAKDLGVETACQIYKALLRFSLKQTLKSDAELLVYSSPGEALKRMEVWLKNEGFHLPVYPQSSGDLGNRLSAAMTLVSQKSPHSACLAIGADCPFLNSKLLQQALASLGTHDMAIGPSTDGGYTLLGFSPQTLAKEQAKGFGIFQNIPWSSSQVYPKSLSYIQAQGYSLYHLPRLRDVDTVEDFHYAQEHSPLSDELKALHYA